MSGHAIHITVDGRKYAGTFTVDRKLLTVSTTYGKISEQWFPLMDRYPYDAQGFRFLGSPIDGIQFEEDRIVF